VRSGRIEEQAIAPPQVITLPSMTVYHLSFDQIDELDALVPKCGKAL
jgi:hypothetical protein